MGRRRLRVAVDGTVQGVGFRPHVHALAHELSLTGTVANDRRGVVIEVEGPAPALEVFLRRLAADAPPLATIDGIDSDEMPLRRDAGFRILDSATDGATRDALIPADTGPCRECLAEVADPGDRRQGYAFTNCTRCGPRFTIVTDVPYDRARTTMARFPLCETCRGEYVEPTDRRFHAEPVCCPACGPELHLIVAGQRRATGPAAIAATAALLRSGRIVAVKGVGGYHFAVAAHDDEAVAELRRRKQRDDKPFAVLVRDLDEAGRLVEVPDEGRDLLSSPAAPIVVLPRLADAGVADGVAPGNRWLGVMLAPSPLHQLLVEAAGDPLVLTSGNVSNEPIAHDDLDATNRLGPIADAFLTHDRPIHVRVDDSVVRVVSGKVLPVRRSRGFAPEPLRMPWPVERPVLAVGAQLKNTFCLAKGRRAFVSHHIGDLENAAVLEAFESGIQHYQRLFDVRPEVVAHDLHPNYLSTHYALDLPDVQTVGVQHHHAHVASCMADNDHEGPVIGIAFDGLGYGSDGGLWGGEVLVADLAGFDRVGHLDAVPQPGGDAAVRQPWRMAASHLFAAFGAPPRPIAVARRHEDQWDAVVQLCRSGLAAPSTTSMGRLFDAVAAIAGVRDEITYEGQAAIELEQRADPFERGTYEVDVAIGDLLTIVGGDLVRAVVADLAGGEPVPIVAARFHNSLAECIERVCGLVRQRTGLDTVALSGGVFQNALLLQRTLPRLADAGFTVLTHRRIPANDGGISFGQAVVAAAQDRHLR